MCIRDRLKDKLEIGKYSKIAFVVAIIFLITLNLPTSTEVTQMASTQSKSIENTHIKIGKILGEYPELKHNTIATIEDAGAIPYFSKWQTYDYTLNDKMTIQNGFSVDRFYENDPKLIFFYDSSARSITGSIESLEDLFIEYYEERGIGHRYDIVTNPQFSNYDLIMLYPKMYIFVEKEFAEENHDLINELIENSVLG